MSTVQDNKWNTVEEPIEMDNPGPIGGSTFKHPAFAQISGARVSGTASLYGSDFLHNGYIKITIAHSELTRTLSRDWPNATREITEIWLSEAQWATFVSSLNSGSGTQCTLRHIKGETVPKLPDPASREEQFKREASETTARATKDLEELTAMIESSSLSGVKKKEMLGKVRDISSSIGSSVEFVLKQFGKHMEKTKEKAKVEIEAYLNSHIQRAGLQALTDKRDRPFELTYNDKENNDGK